MTPRTTFSLLLLGLTLVGAGMVAIDTYFDHLALERLKRYVDHAIEQHALEGQGLVIITPNPEEPKEIPHDRDVGISGQRVRPTNRWLRR